MAQNECIPFYENGDTITVTTPTAVSGKTFAMISASRPYGPGFSLTSTDSGGGNLVCNTATAGAKKFGVFANDQPVAEGKVSVITGVGFIVPVVAGTALGAGEEVSVGAEGKAVKPTTNAAGVAATGELGKVASNNRMVISSVATDSSGNDIRVVIPALGASQAFAFTVNAQEIIIKPKTSAGSVSETTVNETITKLAEAGNAAAADLIKIANAAGSSGAGVLEPGSVSLTGGLDAGQTAIVGMCVSACNVGEDAQIKLY